jgi:hypothetical protein
MFIGIISWYRWAFFYSGGIDCHCLGFVGRLFHVGPTMGKLLPVFTLVLLALATAPWLYRKTICRLWPAFRKVFLVWLLFVFHLSTATGSVEIRGTYDACKYNPASKTHEADKQTSVHAAFIAEISDSRWSICVSNANNGTVSRLWFDGTNTFTLNHEAVGMTGDKDELRATISPSKYYLPVNVDHLDISFPWLVYGLSPRTITPNHLGLVEIPLPWLSPLFHPNAFGYKWMISSSSDGRFLSECKIVRDHALDLSDDEELLRPELSYPMNVAQRDRLIKLLDLNKFIPDGFVVGDYKCLAWLSTNGLSLPVEATVSYYWADVSLLTNSWFEGHLKADKIVVSTEQLTLPEPSDTVNVVDFRYRKFDGIRLYRQAYYQLKAGDTWKSANDPALLEEVQKYLKHGPKYNDMSLGRRKRFIIWSLFIAVWLTPCAIMLYRRKPKMNNTQNP